MLSIIKARASRDISVVGPIMLLGHVSDASSSTPPSSGTLKTWPYSCVVADTSSTSSSTVVSRQTKGSSPPSWTVKGFDSMMLLSLGDSGTLKNNYTHLPRAQTIKESCPPSGTMKRAIDQVSMHYYEPPPSSKRHKIIGNMSQFKELPDSSMNHQLSDIAHLLQQRWPVSNDVKHRNRIGVSTPLQHHKITTTAAARRDYSLRTPCNGDLGCRKQQRLQRLLVSDQETPIRSDSANSEIKTDEQKITGVSLIDYFTTEQVKQHLCSLRQGNAESSTIPCSGGEDNSCQLCAMSNLPYAPLSVYCSLCGILLKQNQTYYGAFEETKCSQYCFCITCFKRSPGDKISCCGISVFKEKLCKKKNSHQAEESWVQCDKCHGWQHQICALYNDKRDVEGKTQYTCPNCYLDGIAAGKLMPLPKKDAFQAKDLPSSKLSNHIEQRLHRSLNKERQERAKALHTNIDSVPEASDLVVRVVSSVVKTFKVNPQFSNIINDDKYPSEFPYKSKVILLFQKIEGVDVFIFGFYVQEYGSNCAQPNRRCIYISYLDSVNYFRPQVKTVSGEALRTFVYHEILIGYLDYCKKRGFATCYIWTCPPTKGDDFILYCHPKFQKTPKPDKLREWYKSMLSKAAEESIVINCSNVYNQFFLQPDIKVTAASLPQFDGAYWSCAGVDIINKIEQEGSQSTKRAAATMTSLKAMEGHKTISKDVLLMQKLGKNILPVKENFIVVRLQYSCSRCHEVIRSKSRWSCNKCKHFQVCTRCYYVEKGLVDGSSHVASRGNKHFLSEVRMDGVAADTEDKDVFVEKGCLENRNSFLSFCVENHYQFDTLRRAKHSSMMILYQLHKSIVPCSIIE